MALVLGNLDWPALAAAVAPAGVSEDVARRIFSRVHREHGTHLDDIRGLRKASRALLARDASFPELELVERRRADDGFVKYLFRTHDGHLIETVRIPLPDPEDARALKERRQRGEATGLLALPTAKHTLCVSSQAGCALACDFCATGRLGGLRNLETWEILAQLRHVAREAEHPIRGVVFMGMGEPFLNYDNVIRAASIMCHPAGPGIAAKAITISTAGVVPMIRRFTEERHHFRLVVSLGSADPEQRRVLMPIEKRWPLPQLMEAVRAHAATTGGRATFAYVALGGLNLSIEHGRKLVALLAGLKAKVSLIDVTDETGTYRRATSDELDAFRGELFAAGIPVVRRYSGGAEIGAACGTLAGTSRGGELVALRTG